jgi:hypothetical protein
MCGFMRISTNMAEIGQSYRFDWRDRQRINAAHPEIEIPNTLSLTKCFKKEAIGNQRPLLEHMMWRLAALTLVEIERTKKEKGASK